MGGRDGGGGRGGGTCYEMKAVQSAAGCYFISFGAFDYVRLQNGNRQTEEREDDTFVSFSLFFSRAMIVTAKARENPPNAWNQQQKSKRLWPHLSAQLPRASLERRWRL